MAKKSNEVSGILLTLLLWWLWPKVTGGSQTRLLYIEPCTKQVFDLNNPSDVTALAELEAAIDAGQVLCS